MTYVNPLDPTTPLGSDAVSQGDDMFRSVKAALIERMDSFFTGHDVQPWQAKSGSGAASLWIVSDAVEAVTRLAYTGAGSRSVELFANATVAGLRDTTGPLTILSYTYSSALTVLNTTGSMQLKVGVGQTIQTIVNGVTIGTWSSTGFTVAAGTTALQALTATTITGTNTVLGSFKFGDAAFSDGVISMYGNADTQNILAIKSSAAYSTNTGKAIIVETNLGGLAFTVAGNGAITTAGGLTVSAGGLTVASGTTSLQATVATQLAATSAVTNGASRTTLSFGDIAGTGRVTAYGANAATIGVLDFVLLSSDGSVGYAPAGRMTGGVFAWGTTVTTSAGQGDMVLANTKALRGNDASGTNTYRLIFVDANNVIQVGDSGSNNLVAIPRGVGIAASANFKGGLYMDSGTAGQLVFFDGVTGARYKLTGTAF